MDIGEADIAVEATYLKYNRTSISQKYNVLAKVIPLEMTLDHADAYGLQTLPQSQMTLRITHEGKPLSQAQWDAKKTWNLKSLKAQRCLPLTSR